MIANGMYRKEELWLLQLDKLKLLVFQQKACQIEQEIDKGLAEKGAWKAIKVIQSG